MEQQIYQLLGICWSAKKIVFGEKLLEAIRQKKVYCVLLSRDLGATQKKMFLNKVTFYEIAHHEFGESLLISKAIGKQNIKAVGITDRTLAQKINSILDK